MTHWQEQGKFCVVLGGEHTVTVGAVQAQAVKRPGLSVLPLDAYSDLRDSCHGSRFNHACVMARVQECCPAVHVGIRSMDCLEFDVVELCPHASDKVHDFLAAKLVYKLLSYVYQ